MAEKATYRGVPGDVRRSRSSRLASTFSSVLAPRLYLKLSLQVLSKKGVGGTRAKPLQFELLPDPHPILSLENVLSCKLSSWTIGYCLRNSTKLRQSKNL